LDTRKSGGMAADVPEKKDELIEKMHVLPIFVEDGE
jgi:hypothetical protein